MCPSGVDRRHGSGSLRAPSAALALVVGTGAACEPQRPSNRESQTGGRSGPDSSSRPAERAAGHGGPELIPSREEERSIGHDETKTTIPVKPLPDGSSTSDDTYTLHRRARVTIRGDNWIGEQSTLVYYEGRRWVLTGKETLRLGDCGPGRTWFDSRPSSGATRGRLTSLERRTQNLSDRNVTA